MARGWESKSVEEQMGATEAEKQARSKPVLSASELELKARRDSLLLSRAGVVREIEAARNERHRALLERSLAHLDAELAKVGES